MSAPRIYRIGLPRYDLFLDRVHPRWSHAIALWVGLLAVPALGAWLLVRGRGVPGAAALTAAGVLLAIYVFKRTVIGRRRRAAAAACRLARLEAVCNHPQAPERLPHRCAERSLWNTSWSAMPLARILRRSPGVVIIGRRPGIDTRLTYRTVSASFDPVELDMEIEGLDWLTSSSPRPPEPQGKPLSRRGQKPHRGIHVIRLVVGLVLILATLLAFAVDLSRYIHRGLWIEMWPLVLVVAIGFMLLASETVFGVAESWLIPGGLVLRRMCWWWLQPRTTIFRATQASLIVDHRATLVHILIADRARRWRLRLALPEAEAFLTAWVSDAPSPRDEDIVLYDHR